MMASAVSIETGIVAASEPRIMAIARACVRLARLAGSSTLRYLVWLAGDLARANHPAARRAWRSRCVRSWAIAMANAVGVVRHVSGPIPSAPFLLVSNHLSYLDIIVLLSLTDGRFVARHDLGSWPFIGNLVRAGGTILVERERRADAAAAARAMRDALDDGNGVVLFPEGTSTAGHHVLPFRSSLFEPAVQLGQPVHTVALRYATPDGSPSATDTVCWWGDMPFASHVWGVLLLPRIDANVAFGAEPVSGGDRKQLAVSAHDSVVALHDALAGEVS